MSSLPSLNSAAPQRRAFWACALVFLHLFIAPCATAMVLMPADADCEHCQTLDSPDACAVASAMTSSVIGGLAFDSGRADLPPRIATYSTRQPAELTPSSSAALLSPPWSRAWATRHSGDPPLYLLLGQLRI